MALTDIPALVKHVTIAIFRGNSISESGESKFMHALKIARGKLMKDGYLASGSDEGDTAGIRLTAKGQRQNLKHMRDSPDKTKEFDKLFEAVALAVDGTDEPDKSTQTPEDKDAQKERVHAEALRAKAQVKKAAKKRYISG